MGHRYTIRAWQHTLGKNTENAPLTHGRPPGRRRLAGTAAACTVALLFPMATAAADEETADDQVSYYTFDDETGADSWGSRSGDTADLDFAEGISGSALRVVDGEGMVFDEPISIGENDAWTISYWVRADEAPTGQVSVLMDKEKDFSTTLKNAAGRDPGFRVGKGSGDFLTFAYNHPTGFEADTWYHVAWTQSKDVGLSNYVNGEQVRTANVWTNPWTMNNRTLIPLDIVGGTGFTGEIDELKVYSRVLTIDEVIADGESTAPDGWFDHVVPEPAEPVEPIPGEFVSQSIALGGDGVFPNYRIPAITQLNNGDILVSYDGRPTGADSPGPNSILQRRSTDGGRTWGETTVISQGKTASPIEGYSDPSYVYDAQTNTLFNFHVYSKNTGFWASIPGTDDSNRDVMSTWVAVSEDNGHTWEHRSLTAVAKPQHVAGTFASSGHGIQITRGEYAGRLVQQYAGRFDDGGIKAYSVYSDDHGETWHMGEPVGTIMDENKVVELSDGTLMMNSRINNTHNARWVAYSADGGETWSEPEMDHRLLDPRNNASIIQMNPGAEAGSAEAKELLFSNSAATSRINGTVSYSCDDGDTWPVQKTYHPGGHSYSDLVALEDGTFGVFFEAEHSEQIYGTFDREWLKPFCADFGAASVEVDAGESAELTFTLTNNDTATLPAGTASLSAPNGWEADAISLPELAPGESAEAIIPIKAPIFAAAGSVVHGDIIIEAGDYSIRGDAVLNVGEGADPALGISIVGFPGDADRDVTIDPYSDGERMSYHFRIDSQSNVSQRVYPTDGDFYPFIPDDGAGNCRWMSLAPSQGYTCMGPFHTVTADELVDGFFLPQSTWALEDTSGSGLEDLSIEVIGDYVSLRERTPGLEVTLTNAEVSDEDGDGYASAGDVITYDVTVTNSGNVRLTGIDGPVTAEELTVEDSLTEQLSYVLTEDDIEAASAEITGVTVTGQNGDLNVSASAEALTVELDVDTTDPTEPVEPVTGNVFFIVNDWESDEADLEFAFGLPGDEVLAGDWDGDGTDTLAIRHGHSYYIYNALDSTDADVVFKYGKDSDEALAGDWNGNGQDTITVRRGHTYYINNTLTGGQADHEYKYGKNTDEALAGDWNGNGQDTITVRRGHTYYINNTLTGGQADHEYKYGKNTDEALAGDWNGNGQDTITVRRGHTYYINNTLTGGEADQMIDLGQTDDAVLIGDWDGDGVDTPALNRIVE